MKITKVILTTTWLIAAFTLSGQSIDSLDFKIGQMIMVGYAGQSVKPGNQTLVDIANGRVGGVILFEKNISERNSYIKFKQLTSTLKKPAPLPLFMALDHEGGKVNRLKEKYRFPKTVSAQYLGEVANADSIRFYGEIYASTLAGLGFNINFAPVVDLKINKNNPVIAKIERSYSANPDSVTLFANTMIEAHDRFGVLSVLKHFPGHGSSHSDTHKGIADVTNYWQPEEIEPYKALIDGGNVRAIMTAHIVNKKLDPLGRPGTLSSQIVTGLLRDSLQFNGLVFTDDMQMHAITKYYGFDKAVELSMLAGVDVLIFSNNIQGSASRTVDSVHDIIKTLVKKGVISEARIDESYRRILKVKNAMF